MVHKRWKTSVPSLPPINVFKKSTRMLTSSSLTLYGVVLSLAPCVLADAELDNNLKIAHACIGTVTWVLFFPLGAVLMRTLKGPTTWLVHLAVQGFSMLCITAVAGMGIKLALDTQQLGTYHAIIGCVLFSLIWLQAAGGFFSHYLYKKHLHRTFLAYSHVWLGRTLITIGMIQGGLGLLLSSDTGPALYKAYGILVAIIWLAFMTFSIWCDFRRPPKRTSRKDQYSS